ncbi:unnamed protein product [Protopolystoma xenopodis]|uniref:Uncharacterized protein n=1 Tax=Protopolystoma xenopodis TaxID=117903 RepID=A0A3S5AC69_9PLAT|nr:unnamed protein product [Protopolystoma xenopodis]
MNTVNCHLNFNCSMLHLPYTSLLCPAIRVHRMPPHNSPLPSLQSPLRSDTPAAEMCLFPGRPSRAPTTLHLPPPHLRTPQPAHRPHI